MASQPAESVQRSDRYLGIPASVKSFGNLTLDFVAKQGRTQLQKEHQSGCLRARMIKTANQEWPTLATINTAGGLTGGDHLKQTLLWQRNAEACVTSVAAEKIYRSQSGKARICTHISVKSGASAEWLPQETILFDGAHLDRELEVHLDGEANFVGCEAIVFGRLARGESLRTGSICEQLKVFRDGELILFDRTQQSGDLNAWLDRNSCGAANRASGTIVIAASEPEEKLKELREALSDAKGLVGATLVRGLVHARFLAKTDCALRHDMSLALIAARGGHDLPRNWSC